MTIQFDIDEKIPAEPFYQWLKTGQKLGTRILKMACVIKTVLASSTRQYSLDNNLIGTIEIDEDGMFVLDNEELEIFAVGETLDKAVDDFADQFDFSYQLFTQKSDSELSVHLCEVKKKYLQIVKQVK